MSDSHPTHTCDICGNEIRSFHSWHANGNTLVHLMCEWNRIPATGESFRWEGDSNLMLEKHGHKHDHIEDRRGRNLPPQMREQDTLDSQ